MTVVPMMFISCRFDGPAPTQEELDAEFTRQLGKRGPTMLRDTERSEHVVNVLSMDGVAIIYGGRALVALGGTPIGIGGEPTVVQWPAWSDRPWTSYGVLEKIRISLRQLRL